MSLVVVESVGVSERRWIDFLRQSEPTEVQYGVEAYQRRTSLVSLVGIEFVIHCSSWTNWYHELVLAEGRHYVSEVY